MRKDPRDETISQLSGIINDLREENRQIRINLDRANEKIIALLDVEAFKSYKMFNAEKKSQPLRPMMFDKEKKVMRQMTEEDMVRDYQGFQELDII